MAARIQEIISFSLLLSLIFLLQYCPKAYSTNTSTDESTLLVLKSHIPSDSILAQNWSSNTPLCRWFGVICASSPNQRVTTLNISNMGLTGTLPPELGNLSRLEMLDLSDNLFEGEIPVSIFNIPSLETISLSGNRFSGNLPDNICGGDRSNLSTLVLSNNELEGVLPLSFSQCSQLQVMSLSYNRFRGNIPSEIGNLRQLQRLYLGSNNLQGQIPEEIGNLSELKEFGIENNVHITGRIPLALFNISSIEVLSLSNNSLIGEIPQGITNIRNLEMLDFGYNSLSGSIPHWIFNISTLRFLGLGGNNLSGTLPPTFGQTLPNLTELYLHINSLAGQIPESISNSSSLTTISLYSNMFNGPIPNSIGTLTLLESLDLSGNRFTSDPISGELTFITSLTNSQSLRYLMLYDNPELDGILPSSIGNSTSLQNIYASRCKIKGNIPNSIGNLSQLIMLDLTDNELTGFVPETFRGLQNLQALSLARNRINGSFPSLFCELNQLSYLMLSGNEFSGPVPDCIGNVTSLREIYLDSNRFSSIPSSLWNLRDLNFLNLSTNSFSGNLPVELGTLRTAIFVDLSRNQFIGDIPSIYGYMENLINFSLSGNLLQGSIPQSFGNLMSVERLDLSNNMLTGEIPKSLEGLQQLKYLNVSFNRLRGEIPREGPFRNFTYQSFMSNEGLCGGDPRFQVSPCRNISANSHRSTWRRRLLPVIIVIPTLLALLLILIFLWMIKYKRKELLKKANSVKNFITSGRFSYQKLQEATDGFSQGNLLGVGSFGSVYRATFEHGMVFAVKVFNLQVEDASKSFEIECEVFRNLRHRNLTKIISACSNFDFKALVLEYMPNGSLEDWLYSDGYFLDISQRLDIMIDVAFALEYLHHGHAMPIIHCDLKPSNILLDKNMVGHVTDFGMAKLLGDEDSKTHTQTLATLGYIAPEYGREGLVSISSDVYSYGILLMETFTRTRPSDGMFDGDLNLRGWIKASLPNSFSRVVDPNLLKSDERHFTEKLQIVARIIELGFNCSADSPKDRMNLNDVIKALEKIKDNLADILREVGK